MPQNLKSLIIILAAFGIGYFGYKLAVRHDFNVICKEYTKAQSQKDNLDRVMLAYETNVNISKKIYTPAAKMAIAAIANAEGSEKYELLLRAASEMGYANWSCSPMKEMFQAYH